MNVTGNHRFINNASQPKCKYCGSYRKRGKRVICNKCGRCNFTYKRAEGTA